MKGTLHRLVLDNPMRIEIARFRRRFLGFGNSTLTNAVFSLILLCYAGLVMLVFTARGDLPPMAIVGLQTALFTLLGPGILHGAIAGERERRSWDLLLVAPITKAQIVVGKFMGAMAALGLGAVAMALPTAIAAVAYRRTSLWDLALGEGVSLSFSALVCAWTIFLSARAKRPFMALATTIGSLAFVFGVAPALFGALASGDRLQTEAFLYFNPISPLIVLGQDMPSQGLSGNDSYISATFFGVPHILLYLGLTVGFLVYAEKTLSFPDNDVKFLPSHQNA